VPNLNAGVYLTDLTFIELGNPDYLPDNNYINFDKRRKVAAIIADMQMYQQHTYNFVELEPVRGFLTSLGAHGWADEKTLYATSWLAEPKEAELEDDDDDDK
jgi:hypothetical protein